MNEKNILTVTQLNEYVKYLIDSSPMLNRVYVRGEISNFTNHYKSGHFYFTLKDGGGLVKAVMFASAAQKLKFAPENGMKVLVSGRVSVFPRDGQYQLYCDGMEPDGIGALYVAFEQLKKRLEAEGLFAESHKKPLPKIPYKIGIVTSPTGAAIRDMINVSGRRFPMASLVLFPALVQGEGAAASIVEGIEYFNKRDDIDLIIIGRGGGSIEDLWAFNEESVAYAVYRSAKPIISAVGHETDFTISDFVADKRAPTPSAAAELAVPDSTDLRRQIGNIIGRMEILISASFEKRRQKLKQLSESKVLSSPEHIVDEKRMTLISIEKQLESAEKLILSSKKNGFVRLTAKLEALNPMSVVSRGYVVASNEKGEVLKSVDSLRVGDNFSIRMTDGTLDASVKGKRKIENG
ncbi:MAG: exodeoxyribonuclease VII large subunit [Ruminococcaceae bacterium]|nr:exodeoxyribonuclease VII large subunit [Oscillospiraceae bacterium]